MKALRQALLLVLVLVLTDALFGFGGLIVPPLHFFFGWIFSLVRLAKQFQWSWALAWWIAGLLAFVLLLSWFCAGFGKERTRLRFVAAFTGIALCVILAGMSLAGSVHQVAWLATSKEPWIGRIYGSRRAMLMHAGSYAGRLMENTSTREEWEKGWREPDRDRPDFHSLFATHVRTNRDGAVKAVVMWPRNGDDFRKIGGTIVHRDDGQMNISREKLLAYLKSPPEVDDEH